MARRRRPRPIEGTFDFTCQHCGMVLMTFVLYSDNVNAESGSYQRALTIYDLAYLRELSGSCPDHYFPDADAEEIFGV